MPPFRFIHTSDLHLGRGFANIPQAADGHTRGRLMEARHGVIGRIAAAALAQGAGHVLLAGDTFDTATPSAPVVRQALAQMAQAEQVHWWLLPGNHDNLKSAEPLWQGLLADAPGNVHAIATAAPVALAPQAMLLPCPVPFRASGEDLTRAMLDMPSPDGALRLGLAHGGVTDFTDSGDTIPPDRDRTARLDYLALGDWHGRIAVSPRVQYSGTPEQDRFKHDRRGVCLAVTLDGPGAVPQITEIETGHFLWQALDLALLDGQDAAAALLQAVPAQGRRDCLVQVRASGWARFPEQARLRAAAARIAPDFAHFDLRMEAVQTLYHTADLDEIDRAGALRLAADRLRLAAEAAELSAEERAVSAAALARLYAYVREGTA